MEVSSHPGISPRLPPGGEWVSVNHKLLMEDLRVWHLYIHSKTCIQHVSLVRLDPLDHLSAFFNIHLSYLSEGKIICYICYTEIMKITIQTVFNLTYFLRKLKWLFTKKTHWSLLLQDYQVSGASGDGRPASLCCLEIRRLFSCTSFFPWWTSVSCSIELLELNPKTHCRCRCTLNYNTATPYKKTFQIWFMAWSAIRTDI